MATHPEGNLVVPWTGTSSLQRLPYYVREMIYIEVLKDSGLGFVLHVFEEGDESRAFRYRLRSGNRGEPYYLTYLCVAQQEETDIGSRLPFPGYGHYCGIRVFPKPLDEATNTYTAEQFQNFFCTPLGWKLHRCHPPFSTFLSLLQTCRQTREELTEVLWRRTDFHCIVHFRQTCSDQAPDIRHAGRREGKRCGPENAHLVLQRQLGDRVIADGIRNLSLHFEARRLESPRIRFHQHMCWSKNWRATWCACWESLGPNACQLIKDLVSSMPNLRHVTIIVREGRRAPRSRRRVGKGIRDKFSNLFRRSTNLQSIRFEGFDAIPVFKVRVDPSVKLSFQKKITTQPPVCLVDVKKVR